MAKTAIPGERKQAKSSDTKKRVGKAIETQEASKQPGGRPTKYNADVHPLLAEVLASAGLTDKQIADKMKISESTLNKWKLDHPGFSESLKNGKAGPDDLVEASLFKRATGFENKKAVKIFMPANAKEPVYAPYTETVHPDVTACIFWLKNRRPDKWRDKQEVKNELSFTAETVELLKDDILGVVNDKRSRKKA